MVKITRKVETHSRYVFQQCSRFTKREFKEFLLNQFDIAYKSKNEERISEVFQLCTIISNSNREDVLVSAIKSSEKEVIEQLNLDMFL